MMNMEPDLHTCMKGLYLYLNGTTLINIMSETEPITRLITKENGG